MEVRIDRKGNVSAAAINDEGWLILSRFFPESRILEELLLVPKKNKTLYVFEIKYGEIALARIKEEKSPKSFQLVMSRVAKLLRRRKKSKLKEYIIKKMIEGEHKLFEERWNKKRARKR